MTNLVTDTGWCTIDIDMKTGRIFVREDWHYNWMVYPTAQPWTYKEKVNFHRQVDRAIWGIWSSGIKLDVLGPAPWPARKVPITFDVRWALSGHRHWEVMANKVPPGSQPTSPIRSYTYARVNIIQLSSADIMPRLGVNEAGGSYDHHQVVAHEFGHTMRWWNDEYEKRSAFIGDTASIMNIGYQVRSRHLVMLLLELNKLIPGVTFSA